jgi:hypothetical protein
VPIPLQATDVGLSKRFVWYSDSKSVEAGTPSALAILECGVAVIGYGAAGYYFGTLDHLWISICMVPLLLFRSDQSSDLGAKWFSVFMKRVSTVGTSDRAVLYPREFSTGVLGSLIIVAMLSYALSRLWLPGHLGWSLYWRSAAIGLFALQLCNTVAFVFGGAKLQIAAVTGVAGALLAVLIVSLSGADLEAVYAALIGAAILSLSAFAVGIWLTSLLIRFLATVRYPIAGFWQVPQNFSRTLFVIDTAQPAELMPGYHEIDMFSSGGVIRELKNSKNPLLLIDLIAFLLPAYLYRFSIKSTWWFYYPLVYIASERELSRNPNKLIERLRNAPKERFSRWIAVLTLGSVFVLRLVPDILDSLPDRRIISVLEYLFLINFGRIQPWLISSLLSALITVGSLYIAIDAYSDLRYPGGASSKPWLNFRIVTLRYMLRVRTVTSTAAILILIGHTLLAFTPAMKWIPEPAINWVCAFYGDHLPKCLL